MHHSRLTGFIIDCQTGDVEQAAVFWSAALGMAKRATEDKRYVVLDASAQDLNRRLASGFASCDRRSI